MEKWKCEIYRLEKNHVGKSMVLSNSEIFNIKLVAWRFAKHPEKIKLDCIVIKICVLLYNLSWKKREEEEEEGRKKVKGKRERERERVKSVRERRGRSKRRRRK